MSDSRGKPIRQPFQLPIDTIEQTLGAPVETVSMLEGEPVEQASQRATEDWLDTLGWPRRHRTLH